MRNRVRPLSGSLGALALVAACTLVGGAPQVAAEERSDPQAFREYDVGDGKVTFDVTDATFQSVVSERLQPRTRVNIDVAPEAREERITLRVVDLHWVYALSMMSERINGVLVRKSPNLLRVDRPAPVELSVENEDVRKVVQLIADFAGASVIVSPDVKGTITVKLKNAPWRSALQYVVETAGKYSVVEGDYGMLRVVPTSTLELGSATYVFRYLRPPPPYKGVIKSGAANRMGGSGGGDAGGSANVGADIVESQVYVPSDDPAKQETQFPVVAALRSIVEPEGGKVTYIPGSNAVLYTGTAPRMARVRSLCEQLDVEPPQVFIDMNIVATTNRDALQFGMRSDTGVQFGATGAGVLHRLPFAASGAGWVDSLTGTAFPPPSAANFSYGTLDFTQTNLLFQFLKQDRCSRVVQAPKILALDNQEATIFIGESIRYARSEAASNQNGGLSFSVEEDENSPVNVGFQLLVIPHVIPGESKIMLLVIPQQRALNGTTSPIPGFERFTVSGQTIDLPRVSSNTLLTTMLLRDKETAVIGGLLEQRDVNGQDKLPLLGDLPILGALFRGQQRSKDQENLLITITPRILRGSDAANTTIADELAGRKDRLKTEWGTLGAQPAPAAPGPLPAPAPVTAPPAPAPVPVAPR